MKYQFEVLPCRDGFHAEKILMDGKHVATLLHTLRNEPSNWRILRKADQRQIQPWSANEVNDLDDAKAVVQTMISTIFSATSDDTWAVECLTAHGHTLYLQVEDNEAVLRPQPVLTENFDAVALCAAYADEPGDLVIGVMAGGDYVTKLTVVRLGVVSSMTPIIR